MIKEIIQGIEFERHFAEGFSRTEIEKAILISKEWYRRDIIDMLIKRLGDYDCEYYECKKIIELIQTMEDSNVKS